MRRVLLLVLLLASTFVAACGPKENFCPEKKTDPYSPGNCNITNDDGSMWSNQD